MKTAWILCVLMLQYGCMSTTLSGKVLAFDSEIECNRAISKYREDAKESDKKVVHLQCQSVESLLTEGKTN